MAITQYEKFFPYIQPYVPECPEFVIETHLAEAAARFCKETYVWRYEFDSDTTISGESLYELDIPSGTVLEDVMLFEIDGFQIARVSDRQVKLDFANRESKPILYDVYMDTQVKLFPTPDDAYTFSGVAVVKPSLTASGVESFIYETYGRCIANGAIAQLTAIPNKAWSDPMMSAMYQGKFSQSIANARIRDFKSVPMRITPRKFA